MFSQKRRDAVHTVRATCVSPGLPVTRTPRPRHRAAVAAAQAAVLAANRYPDERVDVLVTALRAYYGDYTFVTGVGMDGVIETLIRTLVDPGETVAISAPTFSFYGLAAQAQGARVVTRAAPGGFLCRYRCACPGRKGREDCRALHPE